MYEMKTYDHYQRTASTTWTVSHGFGVYPMVETFVSDSEGVYNKAFALSVAQIDENTTEIKWSTARAGLAKFRA